MEPLVLIFLALTTLDWALTVVGLRGGLVELNPGVRGLIAVLGMIPALVVWKALVVGFFLRFIPWRVRTKRVWPLYIIPVILTGVVVWSNVHLVLGLIR